MEYADPRDDIRRVRRTPVEGVFRLDEQMILALVVTHGAGLGLRKQQEIHFCAVPMPRQPVQRGFALVCPKDVAIDNKNRFAAEKRRGLFQSPAGFERFRFIGNMHQGKLPQIWSAGLRPGARRLILQTRRVGDRRSKFLPGEIIRQLLLEM